MDNIQLWAGFRGGGLADVDKVQLWLVLLRGWAAKEERGKRMCAWDEERQREGSRGTGMESMLV